MVPVALSVDDRSHVSAARIGTQRIAHSLGFDEVRVGRVSIAVTEATTNMLRHAGGGFLVAQAIECAGELGLEVLAIDTGPGMPDFEHSATDGISSAGTSGTGLGAMRRQSDEFDVYTRRGDGAIVRMAFWAAGRAPEAFGYQVGAICVSKPGEDASGDAWGSAIGVRGAAFLVADGLGHGPDAARAAALAVDALHRHPEAPPARVLEVADSRLRSTRGAALAVVRHEPRSDSIAFAGVGNIAASVWHGEARRSMVSHNGIVGHNVRKLQEYHYPWPRGALLVVHSDGLETHWSLQDFPGLSGCHASVIAAALYRKHWRRRDDVVVLVARRSD